MRWQTRWQIGLLVAMGLVFVFALTGLVVMGYWIFILIRTITS